MFVLVQQRTATRMTGLGVTACIVVNVEGREFVANPTATVRLTGVNMGLQEHPASTVMILNTHVETPSVLAYPYTAPLYRPFPRFIMPSMKFICIEFQRNMR